MSFFFCDISLSLNTAAEIGGEVAHHIGTVRRVKKGEEVELQDPSGARFVARIDEIARRSITVTPLRPAPIPASPARAVTLLQAYIAEQKLDLILQKATELGAARIIVWQADHSPHEISPERLAHKHERFEAIMRNACEQSGRSDVPILEFSDSLEDGLASLADETPVFLNADGSGVFPTGTLALVVGPEGGFSDAEDMVRAARNCPTISIGTYTLRAETAAIAGLALCAG